jgi:hypothetical protein
MGKWPGAPCALILMYGMGFLPGSRGAEEAARRRAAIACRAVWVAPGGEGVPGLAVEAAAPSVEESRRFAAEAFFTIFSDAI